MATFHNFNFNSKSHNHNPERAKMLFSRYYIDIEESAISFMTKFVAPKKMAKKGLRNEYLFQKHCLSSNTSNVEFNEKFSPGTLGAFCTLTDQDSRETQRSYQDKCLQL